jgi:cephalosporin-C deacetylase-like acetyl esterase
MIRHTRSITLIIAVRVPRESILMAFVAGAFTLAVNGPLPASGAAQDSRDLSPLNRFPTMMQEYFVSRARQLQVRRTERLRGIDSREDAQAYVDHVREAIRESFGQLPDKTELHARTVGVLDRDGYRIEKVLFQSRPQFWVTANLYIPNGKPFPLPAVIGTCGHSDNGKAAEPYQAFCQGLVKQGFVVLIYDPISQGERLQYVDASLKSRHGPGVQEHLLAGNQQLLVGEFLGTWRAWDGIRALDYLLSRPEVDPRQVGVTGNSGGGTMATWLAALDHRWTMAAPSCFVTSFQRNLENELPADTEQCPPRALQLGLDHADFLAVMMPKPVIILTKERDYFDVRGSERAFAELQSLYAWFDATHHVALFTGPTGHGYSQENREAMYEWFNRAVGGTEAATAQVTEPAIEIVADEQLWCAPQGQVARLESRTIYDFTAEKARQLKSNRRSLRGDELRQAISQSLRIGANVEVPDYRILRPIGSRNFPRPHLTTYAVETEPGVQAIVYRVDTQSHLSRPPKGDFETLLYISDLSSDDELRNDPWLRQLIANHADAEVYACDVRGTGESQPDTCGENSFLIPYGSDYFYAVHAIMLDDPYPGQKARDILRVIAWLHGRGRREIHVVAQARGTIPAAIAGVFADGVQRITLRKAPASFQFIAESQSYSWPLSTLIPNALATFDLPDVYDELRAHKRLELVELAE